LIASLALLGMDTYPAESEAEAHTALEDATAKKEPALLFITERLAVDLQTKIEKLNRRPDMNVVLIPDNQGSTGLATSQIDKLVKNSIGAEVIIRK
jgi:vacuolar-type H+-ATPase subunit F/Vma7